MAARLNLVVLCAVALLAAVVPTDARRYGPVSVVHLGKGSYSSSRGVSIPRPVAKRGTDLLGSAFEDEKARIMQEFQDSQKPASRSPSKASTPSASGRSWPFGSGLSSSPSRSPIRFGARSESKQGGNRAVAEVSATTSGGGRVVTRGRVSTSVGGSRSSSRSGSGSFLRRYTRG